MPRQANQHKPTPPLEIVKPFIMRYWIMRKTDVEILRLLKDKHFDTEVYGLGMTRFREMRAELGLKRARQEAHTFQSIHEPMRELREKYPKAGAVEMRNLLFFEKGLSVSRALVSQYFRVYEPNLVHLRRSGRLVRKRFWAAGVNDVLSVDQHDKWLRFGLKLHTGIDPFVGRIHWLKIWWTNSNPILIASYYLDFVEELGHMPLITQSDPGTENNGIANAHTALRHYHDPALVGTLQHRFMKEKKNVMPEITWSQLRRRFTPGFEDVLDLGVNSEWFDINDTLHVYVFRWLFIPWLQSELDAYRIRLNNTRKRANRNKVLPHGPPDDIFANPEEYDCRDFKIQVEKPALEHVRSTYAPPEHRVFILVPESFDRLAQIIYASMDSPEISRDNIWGVFHGLVQRFSLLDEAMAHLAEWDINLAEDNAPLPPEAPYKIPEGIAELFGGPRFPRSDGSCYIGGLDNGLGPCERLPLFWFWVADESDFSVDLDDDILYNPGDNAMGHNFSDEEEADEVEAELEPISEEEYL